MYENHHTIYLLSYYNLKYFKGICFKSCVQRPRTFCVENKKTFFCREQETFYICVQLEKLPVYEKCDIGFPAG